MRGKNPLRSILPAPVLTAFFLACTGVILASPGGRFEVERVDPAPLLGRLAARHGSLSAVQGELIQVGTAGGVLRTGRERQAFRFHPDAVIYVNGRPACPDAARPVGSDQFFWAGLWQSRTGEVLLMEAVYCGGEMAVISISPGFLTGFAPETGAVLYLPVASSCRRPLLSEGDEVYVLLDLQGEIRRIWRLEGGG